MKSLRRVEGKGLKTVMLASERAHVDALLLAMSYEPKAFCNSLNIACDFELSAEEPHTR